jgi:hypothetical protein
MLGMKLERACTKCNQRFVKPIGKLKAGAMSALCSAVGRVNRDMSVEIEPYDRNHVAAFLQGAAPKRCAQCALQCRTRRASPSMLNTASVTISLTGVLQRPSWPACRSSPLWRVALQRRLGQQRAVDQRGVVELVGKDRRAGIAQRGEQREVGHVAGAKALVLVRKSQSIESAKGPRLISCVRSAAVKFKTGSRSMLTYKDLTEHYVDCEDRGLALWCRLQDAAVMLANALEASLLLQSHTWVDGGAQEQRYVALGAVRNGRFEVLQPCALPGTDEMTLAFAIRLSIQHVPTMAPTRAIVVPLELRQWDLLFEIQVVGSPRHQFAIPVGSGPEGFADAAEGIKEWMASCMKQQNGVGARTQKIW